MDERKKLTKSDLGISDFNFQAEMLDCGVASFERITRTHTFDMDVYLPEYGVPLQRGLCWSLEQKQALIMSLLRGTYVPPLTCLYGGEFPELTHEVIDGKQRLDAILGFLHGDFPITVNGSDYRYADIDLDLALTLTKNLPMMNVCTDVLSDRQKVELFLTLNFKGVPQNEAYMYYLGNLIK